MPRNRPGEKFKEFKGSEESGDLQGRVGGLIESYSLVKEFLDSPNFQTCIQVQSLFVDAQFETFQGEHGALLKRVFPDWFLGANPIYKTNYQHFWYEWRLLLNCMSSGSETGPIRECAGEIDRCWWAALGAHNFLSKMHSRYTSFRFQTDNKLDPRRQKTFEGVMTSGDE